MVNFQEQKEFIKFGYRVISNLYTFDIEESDFEFIADQWNLSPEMVNIVGEKGYFSFPYELSNMFTQDSRHYIRASTFNLREVLSARELSLNAKILLENYQITQEEYDIIDKLKNNLEYQEVGEIVVDKNKVLVILEEEFKDINGKSFKPAARGTVRKTVDKLIRDVYKEHYSLVKKVQDSRIEQFNKALTILEQKVSTAYIEKGTMYVSALPKDILTASINNRSWGSCFAPDGEWALAPYNYLRNNNTLIAYFVSDKNKDRRIHSQYYVDYSQFDIHDKEWRSFMFLTNEGNIAFSSQQYPFTESSVVKDIAYEIIDRNGGFFHKNARVNREGDTYIDGIKGVVDLNRSIDTGLNHWEVEDYVSDDRTICVESEVYVGDHDSIQESFKSDELTRNLYCDSCGNKHYEDEAHFVESGNWREFICDHCLDDLIFCEEVLRCHVSGKYFFPNYENYITQLTWDGMKHFLLSQIKHEPEFKLSENYAKTGYEEYYFVNEDDQDSIENVQFMIANFGENYLKSD